MNKKNGKKVSIIVILAIVALVGYLIIDSIKLGMDNKDLSNKYDNLSEAESIQDEMNSEIENILLDENESKYLEEFKVIQDKKITLIKYGSYYQLYLVLDLDNKLTLRQVSNLEKKIKKSITRHTSFDIKYVTIYVTNKID